jgi:hypothetical protein
VFALFTQWLGLSALLHLIWEIAQLPLYTIYAEGDLATIAFAVGHCTGGDVVIATGTYLVAALVARHGQWPIERPRLGLGASIVAGVAYTVFSEWLNVSVRGSWEYAAAMPEVLGIGLSPLFQWLVVPGSRFSCFGQRAADTRRN